MRRFDQKLKGYFCRIANLSGVEVYVSGCNQVTHVEEIAECTHKCSRFYTPSSLFPVAKQEDKWTQVV
jgi:hypothetical protein